MAFILNYELISSFSPNFSVYLIAFLGVIDYCFDIIYHLEYRFVFLIILNFTS